MLSQEPRKPDTWAGSQLSSTAGIRDWGETLSRPEGGVSGEARACSPDGHVGRAVRKAGKVTGERRLSLGTYPT